MNFPAIPEIDDLGYLSIEMTFSFGKGKNHLVVRFCSEGDEYYPTLIMDEASTFPMHPNELTALAKWSNKMCKFLNERTA